MCLENEIQDAYALCRVFKKTAVITTTKIEDHHHYVSSSSHIANQHIINASDDQSSSIELYSEGRGEDLDSSNYNNLMPLDHSSIMSHNNNNNIANIADHHSKWSSSHFLPEDPFFSLPNSSSLIPNHASAITYPPSKVRNTNIY